MNAIDIAYVTHEVNRAIQEFQGDPAVSPPWVDAPAWQIESAIEGVQGVLDGNTPEQSHESWLAFKASNGWVYGPVKDEALKTHPCIVPYDDLPPEQKLKDHVFVAIVKALDSAPTDALREVKAQAWDEGFDAGRDDLGAAQVAIEHGEDENPYRKAAVRIE